MPVIHAPHRPPAVAASRTRRHNDLAAPATEMIAGSEAFADLLRNAEKVASYDLTALIVGESGTGKTSLARFIHEHSPRKHEPLVVVNCAALPHDLLESELFGHAEGAFTGAVAERPGRVETCDGGTLVLDEVGDLPLELQPKLLMFLQDRVYYRVGCDRPRHANVRLIAATNRPLLELCSQQKFREDLYYRLSVLKLEMPPLRDQPSTIPSLADAILRRIAHRTNSQPKHLTARAMQRLQGNPWPGNVRELENVLERAAVYCEGNLIDDDSLHFDEPAACGGATLRLAGRRLKDIEDQAIAETLEICGGNRASAAKMLGISERSVYNKLKRVQRC